MSPKEKDDLQVFVFGLVLCAAAGLVYIAWHFIQKYW
jgi:hypothetical protein